jgi:hypothetical protein
MRTVAWAHEWEDAFSEEHSFDVRLGAAAGVYGEAMYGRREL